MSSRRWGLAAFALAIVTAAAIAAEPGSAEPQVYRPVMSDLMNMVIQPRHTKLWLAGHSAN